MILQPASAGFSYFIGVDAGGSHCRARLVDPSGAVLGVGKTGPANTGLGLEAVCRAVMRACDAAFDDASLDRAEAARTSAGVGIAGLSRSGARDRLDHAAFPFAKVVLATDAEIANLGAHRGQDGAILIMGTGSVAQITVGGGSHTLGGYGFPISDEGSGAALGLSAMRHALRALDGRTLKTPLSTAITERFGHDPVQAIAWMDQATPGDYAQFAPIVMHHAEADDPIARSIVESAAQHIERFVETIFEQGAPRCSLMGGLSQSMVPWLRKRTLDRLSPPLDDALSGALYLAGLDFAPQGKI